MLHGPISISSLLLWNPCEMDKLGYRLGESDEKQVIVANLKTEACSSNVLFFQEIRNLKLKSVQWQFITDYDGEE